MSGHLYIMWDVNKAPIIMIPHSIAVTHHWYHVAIHHGQFSLESRHDGERTMGCTRIDIMNACIDLKHTYVLHISIGVTHIWVIGVIYHNYLT